MSKRRNARKAARPASRAHKRGPYSFHRRSLRFEPLEDRRLLAVVTVNTLSDTVDATDGLTSLREAIIATNTAAGADTIDFAPSLTSAGPGTILLTQGELKVTDSLTLSGPGASLLTLDASGSDPTPAVKDGKGSRVFNISEKSATLLDVSLSGLRLTGGDPNSYGGAISNTENLTITGCTIDSNHSVDGGDIYSASANLTVIDSIISGNSGNGTSGVGGIAATHTNTTIIRTSIRNNTGTTYAGGIRNFQGTLVVSGSIVTGNSGARGGGIGTQGGPAYVDNSIISHNSGGLGGGINVYNANLTVTNSMISGNTASYEGGAIDGSPSNSILLNGVTITGNSAMYAGAVNLINFRQLAISNCTISGNSANAVGALELFGSMNPPIIIGNSTIAYNSSTNFPGGKLTYPGGIFTLGQLQLDHVILAKNTGVDASYGSIVARFSLIGNDRQPEAPVGMPDANGNLIGGRIHGAIDPGLGPLADNGGFTLPDGSHILTHALLPGSPAIDAGDPNAVAGAGSVSLYDQRSAPFTRVYGGRIDIGACELQPTDYVLGDFDRNGVVDASDYVLWRRQTGSNVAPGAGADGNGDGIVNDADLLVWRSNFGTSTFQLVANRFPITQDCLQTTPMPATTLASQTSLGTDSSTQSSARNGSASLIAQSTDDRHPRGNDRAAVLSGTSSALPGSKQRLDSALKAWLASPTNAGSRRTAEPDARVVAHLDWDQNTIETASLDAATDEAFAGMATLSDAAAYRS